MPNRYVRLCFFELTQIYSFCNVYINTYIIHFVLLSKIEGLQLTEIEKIDTKLKKIGIKLDQNDAQRKLLLKTRDDLKLRKEEITYAKQELYSRDT